MYTFAVDELNFLMKEPIRFRQEYFPAATDIISWCMQNLSSIHKLSKKFEGPQGFTMVHQCQHCAYVAHEQCSWRVRGSSGKLRACPRCPEEFRN